MVFIQGGRGACMNCGMGTYSLTAGGCYWLTAGWMQQAHGPCWSSGRDRHEVPGELILSARLPE